MRYLAVLLVLACVGCGSSAAPKESEVCSAGGKVYETGSVDAVCQAMKEAGFKSVRAIVCGGEKPVVDKITVDGITFKGIRYTGGVFKDRYAIAEVTDAAGNRVSRFTELMLILNGKIPHSGYGGGWLSTRNYDFKDFTPPKGTTVTSMSFLYDTTGAKAEKVGEWKGFPIYHVTNACKANYFAVEAAGHNVTCYPYE